MAQQRRASIRKRKVQRPPPYRLRALQPHARVTLARIPQEHGVLSLSDCGQCVLDLLVHRERAEVVQPLVPAHLVDSPPADDIDDLHDPAVGAHACQGAPLQDIALFMPSGPFDMATHSGGPSDPSLGAAHRRM
eukprot:CAMPEP_0206249204 /NCGR_PEP_ID=MMETSP0047_2-20121206/20785_1 /ASSEMBLY_ACC=CAM_ASM_000192 /TAXON_ID=195065 /ORGANISM="Chroomonas mesostigmatica_cf, Strain CCMP1168" /LENGTH=133 /DNA_ID=CAMNT_0053674913 /DNA_START=95 /DNA_END=497 /DNA_ORIENTATION=-